MSRRQVMLKVAPVARYGFGRLGVAAGAPADVRVAAMQGRAAKPVVPDVTKFLESVLLEAIFVSIAFFLFSVEMAQ